MMGDVYPCAECGTPRTKEQGGAVFTVCDDCWPRKPRRLVEETWQSRAEKAEARVAELEGVVEAARAGLRSAAGAMATSSRDWGRHHVDAWLWELLCGWGDAWDEIAARGFWSAEDVARLRRLSVGLRAIDGDQAGE